MKTIALAVILSALLCTSALALDIDVDNNNATDIAYGGTNANDAATARQNLGLEIGVDVAAYDHNHDGVYEPYESSPALRDEDISVSVHAYMATATEGEMEDGVQTELRAMSPALVKAAIDALAGTGAGDLKADGTVPLTADWNAGAYTITAGGFATAKTDGVAGDVSLYEGNSTDTHSAGFRGPASITGDGAYRGVFPNAKAGVNQVMVWTSAEESGTGTATDPYLQPTSWVSVNTWYGYDVLPIAWAADGTSPPDALNDRNTRKPYQYRTFASDADEDVNFVWFVPSDLSGTTVQFRVKYLITNATGPSSSEGVAFGLSGVSIGDNDATNAAKGTVVVVTDDELNAAQHDILITGWSGDVTITNLAAGEVAELAFIRDVSDAVDDYGQVVGVIAVEIRYNRTVTRP